MINPHVFGDKTPLLFFSSQVSLFSSEAFVNYSITLSHHNQTSHFTFTDNISKQVIMYVCVYVLHSPISLMRCMNPHPHPRSHRPDEKRKTNKNAILKAKERRKERKNNNAWFYLMYAPRTTAHSHTPLSLEFGSSSASITRTASLWRCLFSSSTQLPSECWVNPSFIS